MADHKARWTVTGPQFYGVLNCPSAVCDPSKSGRPMSTPATWSASVRSAIVRSCIFSRPLLGSSLANIWVWENRPILSRRFVHTRHMKVRASEEAEVLTRPVLRCLCLSSRWRTTNIALLKVDYCLLTCCPPGCPVCGQALKVSWFDANGVEVDFERILIPLALTPRERSPCCSWP